MKQLIFMCLLIIFPYSIYADNVYSSDMYINKQNKLPVGSVDVSMDYKFNSANPYRKTEEDTINTIGLNLRYDCIDFYGYIDIHDVFYIYTDEPYIFGKINNYLYGEINPRISIVSLSKQSLNSKNIFKDFLIAYNFTFDSDDLLQHYFGFGIDLNIPIFSYLKINFYARYNQAYYGRNENSFDGFLLNVMYEIPIYKFSQGIEIVYSSWLKYIFGATSDLNVDIETDYSVQWKNTFKVGYKNFYIAYSYQTNINYFELNTKKAQTDEHSVGVYYFYKF